MAYFAYHANVLRANAAIEMLEIVSKLDSYTEPHSHQPISILAKVFKYTGRGSGFFHSLHFLDDQMNEWGKKELFMVMHIIWYVHSRWSEKVQNRMVMPHNEHLFNLLRLAKHSLLSPPMLGRLRFICTNLFAHYNSTNIVYIRCIHCRIHV